jgi:hypothetical protein
VRLRRLKVLGLTGLCERSSVDLALLFVDCRPVSAEEVDEYLPGLDEPKRSPLEALRRTIHEIVS